MTVLKLFCGCLVVTSLYACSAYEVKNSVDPGDVPPVGSKADIAYADKVWRVMEAERMVGANAAKQEPFFGGAKPHGMVLELVYRNVKVNNHDGFIVVKKNYDGDGVSVESVTLNRSRYLSSITIMYQRESGYDEDNQNWFWAKYKPDGRLFQKPGEGKITQLAGRIWKGKTKDQNKACIYCHSSAGGGDYIFYPDIKIPVAN
jgi:hypothetical protein